MNLWEGPVRDTLVLVAVALASVGCGGVKTDPASGASFAAPVSGTEGFVGVVVNPRDRRVLACPCDGQALAARFSGQADPDGAVALSSPVSPPAADIGGMAGRGDPT